MRTQSQTKLHNLTWGACSLGNWVGIHHRARLLLRELQAGVAVQTWSSCKNAVLNYTRFDSAWGRNYSSSMFSGREAVLWVEEQTYQHIIWQRCRRPYISSLDDQGQAWCILYWQSREIELANAHDWWELVRPWTTVLSTGEMSTATIGRWISLVLQIR